MQLQPLQQPGTEKRVLWWQSIRWQLALVSILVALLATTLLAIAVIVAINYYYGADQRQRLMDIAGVTAQRVGDSYAQSGSLAKSVNEILPTTANDNDQ